MIQCFLFLSDTTEIATDTIQLFDGMGLTLEMSNPEPFWRQAAVNCPLADILAGLIHIFFGEIIKKMFPEGPNWCQSKAFLFYSALVLFNTEKVIVYNIQYLTCYSFSRFWLRSSNAASKKLQQQLASTLHVCTGRHQRPILLGTSHAWPSFFQLQTRVNANND